MSIDLENAGFSTANIDGPFLAGWWEEVFISPKYLSKNLSFYKKGEGQTDAKLKVLTWV